MELKKCSNCKKQLPLQNFDPRKTSNIMKKGCRICLQEANDRRHKNDVEEELYTYETDPTFVFKANVTTSAGCDSDQLKRFCDSDTVDRFYPYLRNLRNNARIQIRTHLRFKCYRLEWIVNSGMLDKFACYDEKTMKEIREGL